MRKSPRSGHWLSWKFPFRCLARYNAQNPHNAPHPPYKFSAFGLDRTCRGTNAKLVATSLELQYLFSYIFLLLLFIYTRKIKPV